MIDDNWPSAEAWLEAEHFIEHHGEYGPLQNCERLSKLHQHWQNVFGIDEQGKADLAKFRETFNGLITEAGFSYKL